MAFKAAICPSCGGNLQVPDDRASVKCMYCGSDIIVRQAIQAGSGVNIDNYLKLAVTANKAGNYQEAYRYYSKVLEYDINNPEAWFGKARAAGWLSTFADFRDSEIISGFQNSLDNIPEEKLRALRVQCASEIYRLYEAYFNLIHNQVSEYGSSDDIWNTYIPRCESLISLMEFGHSLDPNNQEIMNGIIHICKINLGGIKYDQDVQYTNANGASWFGTEDQVRRLSGNWQQYFTDKMNLFSNKLKMLNPDFKQPEVKKQYSSKEIACICCVVIIILIVIFSMLGKH
jgi:tetratricopeptide (TPR) repeat protein